MASTTCSVLFLLVLAAFTTTRASAATFTIKNNCGYMLWAMGVPVSVGTPELNPGQTTTVDVPRGTKGSFWGVKPADAGCKFNATTGRYDCPGHTTAEYTIGGSQDSYDISVAGGYNLPMAFSCSTGVGLVCRDAKCPDAYQNPKDGSKTHACNAKCPDAREAAADDDRSIRSWR